MRLVAVLTTSAALLAATTAASQEAPTAQVTAMTADTPQTAPSGAIVTFPKAWKVKRSGDVLITRPPEADTRIALVSVPEAVDAMAAATEAWRRYRPDLHPPIKLLTARAPRNGWDERDTVDYETSPNEKAVVQATTFRSGKHWTVLIIDASEATAEKRGAAIDLIVQSLHPAGYTRETFAGRTAHPLDAARVDAMRSFVETSIHQLGVPGAAIALIDHGRVVYEGGVGLKALGRPDPVDAHTLFMVGSNTKGMTTLLLAELVDQGKLAWDEPVTQVYPGFRLGSEATTRKVLIKHLVCACTGLPRKDLQFLLDTSGSTPASTTFVQLAATEPTSGFGEVFQYNNLMVAAAGYIGAHVLFPGQEIGADLVFDFGLWRSRVASRKNDDGTLSFITIDPANDGFEFVITRRLGRHALVIRDGQHEYTYSEAT